MPDDGTCNAACQKIIIDFFLSVFYALFYARSLERRDDLEPKHHAAALLYAETAGGTETTDGFSAIALMLNRSHLSSENQNRLIEQSLKECYRADEFKEWGMTAPADAAEAEARTVEILEWVKQSQEWYTAFALEVGH